MYKIKINWYGVLLFILATALMVIYWDGGVETILFGFGCSIIALIVYGTIQELRKYYREET